MISGGHKMLPSKTVSKIQKQKYVATQLWYSLRVSHDIITAFKKKKTVTYVLIHILFDRLIHPSYICIYRWTLGLFCVVMLLTLITLWMISNSVKVSSIDHNSWGTWRFVLLYLWVVMVVLFGSFNWFDHPFHSFHLSSSLGFFSFLLSHMHVFQNSIVLFFSQIFAGLIF